MYEYRTTGTCSTKIHFDIRDNRVYNIAFENGCNGNLKGIAILAEGMEVNELIKRCKGIQCKNRGTSCPDQLAAAIAQATKAAPD